MGLSLTRGQIINQGLIKAGRPDLVTDARLWLNLFLEEMYFNQDWDWLVKSADGLAVVQGRTLPDDYRAAKSASITVESSEGATKRELLVVTNAAEWDELRRTIGSTTGTPTVMFVEHDTKKMYFSPEPVSGLSFDLKYYYLPNIPSHQHPENDDEIVKWELPNSILVDHIKVMAYDYNDDTRQEKGVAAIKAKLQEYKTNSHDRRAGKSRIPLGKSFKKRWGY